MCLFAHMPARAPCVFYEKSVGIGCSGCLDKTYGESNNYIPVPPANDRNLYEPTFVDNY